MSPVAEPNSIQQEMIAEPRRFIQHRLMIGFSDTIIGERPPSATSFDA